MGQTLFSALPAYKFIRFTCLVFAVAIPLSVATSVRADCVDDGTCPPAGDQFIGSDVTSPSVPAPEGAGGFDDNQPFDPNDPKAAADKAKGADDEESEGNQSCEVVRNIANLTCNTLSYAHLDPEEGMAVEMMMGQAVQMIHGIQAQGDNINAQCKSQMDLSKILGMINGIKAAGCASTMKKCETQCKKELSAIDNGMPTGPEVEERRKLLKKQIADCRSYKTNFIGLMMQTMNFGNNFLQNRACVKSTATLPVAGASPLPFSTPGAVEFPKVGDCSDPQVARSNIACICQTDPTNPICGGALKPGDFNASTVDSSPNLAGGAAGVPFMPNEDLLPGADGVLDQASGQPTQYKGTLGEQGGGGGGGLAGGGGRGPGAQDEGGYLGGSNIDKNVIQGTSGGSGGGGSGGGGGGGGYGRGWAAKGSSSDNDKDEKFDLKKFLPDKKDLAQRGLAGMSVPSVDGVTGPMGPSIWEKVSSQYQKQKPSLIQDR